MCQRKKTSQKHVISQNSIETLSENLQDMGAVMAEEIVGPECGAISEMRAIDIVDNVRIYSGSVCVMSVIYWRDKLEATMQLSNTCVTYSPVVSMQLFAKDSLHLC